MTPQESTTKKHRLAYALPVFLIVLVVFVGMTIVIYRVISSGTTVKSTYSRVATTSLYARDLSKQATPDLSTAAEQDSAFGRDDTEQAVAIIQHTPLPEEVRGIYWTASTAGSSRGQELVEYMLETGLNTAVIDLKMDDGELAFIPNDSSMQSYAMSRPAIADLDALLQQLFEKGIYRIARIPVMRDGAFAFVHPELAMKNANGRLWEDNIGSHWIDPASSEVGDYAIALAQEAYTRGFDEVQFDYVRFASDGQVNGIVYPLYDRSQSKVEVMQRFFRRVGSSMREQQIPVSFDLFGMTYWSFDDFNIGQRLVDVFPFSDWTSAMVYPSHYPDGFKGIDNPALEPYFIVNASMNEGVKRQLGIYAGTEEALRATFRPWLQDFDIGAVYTAHLIEEQIRGARDAGASGWILWNARNVYERAVYSE